MKIILKSSPIYLVLMFLFSSCTEDLIETPRVQEYAIDLSLSLETNWPLAYEILDGLNTHRDSINLPTLIMDQTYASALAVEHTKYMISQNTISHNGLNTRTAALISKGATFVGENVAKGFTSGDAVLLGWLGSPDHKAILEGNYTHVGFGILQDEEGIYYYTMLLYQ
ncbi:CAP domain-containing protein [Ulvibacter antarcticus]|uniref:Cysteine-rich secretory protein family protein n=1 Tax=Ulvibacter antarcticus TaxID=442714 RepID=A0A3L9Z018_9FLAO|nr:CAP domain-containing protein [Ulvibacter antarcticus]RMA66216.1 Cysteine-rich secretory protein family protein [Ulvibacter antarcticus]